MMDAPFFVTVHALFETQTPTFHSGGIIMLPLAKNLGPEDQVFNEKINLYS
jgi:hypothetical protein